MILTVKNNIKERGYSIIIITAPRLIPIVVEIALLMSIIVIISL